MRLLPLLIFMYALARDLQLMAEYRISGAPAVGYIVIIVGIAVCLAALAILTVP